MMPFCPPVTSRRFDDAVFDDEAEGDGDHRQVRDRARAAPARPAARPRRRQQRATGHAAQKLQPALVVSTATA
jgi:hypothetical protein